MDEELKTSFIPQRNVERDKAPQGSSFFSLISIIVFITIIAISGGIFLYKRFLINETAKSSVILEKERGIFESALIQELSRADLRINFSKEILKKHIAPSMIFQLLGRLTLQDLRFSSFSYGVSEDGAIKILMDGEAKNYSVVVLQSKIFGESKYIKDALFSNLNVNAKGMIIFNLSASIDPRYISYENRLKEDISESEVSVASDEELKYLLESAE